jgi:hypothetical protein
MLRYTTHFRNSFQRSANLDLHEGFMLKLSNICPISLFCLLLTLTTARTVRADQIENLVFTGTATCTASSCSSFGTGPITGTFTLDVTTQTFEDAWSFSTPFGMISSADPGTSTSITDKNGGFAAVFQESSGSFFEFVQLTFSNPQELGTLLDVVSSDACHTIPKQGGCTPDYTVTGSTVLAPVATPEPPSLMLFGAGMVGVLGLSLRRLF